MFIKTQRKKEPNSISQDSFLFEKNFGIFHPKRKFSMTFVPVMNLKCVAAIAKEMLVAVNNPDQDVQN